MAHHFESVGIATNVIAGTANWVLFVEAMREHHFEQARINAAVGTICLAVAIILIHQLFSQRRLDRFLQERGEHVRRYVAERRAMTHEEAIAIFGVSPFVEDEPNAGLRGAEQLEKVVKMTGASRRTPPPNAQYWLRTATKTYLVRYGSIFELDCPGHLFDPERAGCYRERSTCFYPKWAMPISEAIATALLHLWLDPNCFDRIHEKAKWVNPSR